MMSHVSSHRHTIHIDTLLYSVPISQCTALHSFACPLFFSLPLFFSGVQRPEGK